MKLNEIDFNQLSDKELVMICLKYQLITKEQLPKMTRNILLQIIMLLFQIKRRLSLIYFFIMTPKGILPR